MRNLVLIALLLLTPVLAAQQMPTTYTGTYTWSDDPREFEATLKVKESSRQGAAIAFQGELSYQPGDYTVLVAGTIAADGTLSMTETQPNQQMVVEGRHQGKATADLGQLTATWTSDKGGRTGTLELKAR